MNTEPLTAPPSPASRLEKLAELAKHFHYRKYLKAMRPDELLSLRGFVSEHGGCNPATWTLLGRAWLEAQGYSRTKHALMDEVMQCLR